MADHFYSIATEGAAFPRDPSKITVGTSSTTTNVIELRVTDAAVSAQEVYAFTEWLADLFATRNSQVIVAGTLKSP